MTYDYNPGWEIDIKQDIETYIDWDVDTKINVDIEKDVDVDINVDIDVKDNGALIEAIVKDIGPLGGLAPVSVTANTSSIENVLSQSSLDANTGGVHLDLSANALDRSASEFVSDYHYPYFDSATFTEINIGVDKVAFEGTIITLNMEALVDG